MSYPAEFSRAFGKRWSVEFLSLYFISPKEYSIESQWKSMIIITKNEFNGIEMLNKIEKKKEEKMQYKVECLSLRIVRDSSHFYFRCKDLISHHHIVNNWVNECLCLCVCLWQSMNIGLNWPQNGSHIKTNVEQTEKEQRPTDTHR